MGRKVDLSPHQYDFCRVGNHALALPTGSDGAPDFEAAPHLEVNDRL